MLKFPGVEIRASNVSGSAFLGIINMKGKPYDDVRVRQAVAHGINRAFIRENVMPGFSENQIGPLPPSMSLANKALKDYDYDPKRANQMLDAAGYPRKADGTRFEFRLLWATNDIRITFEKNARIEWSAGEWATKSTFKIDPAKRPKTMDVAILENRLIPESKGTTIRMIYEWDKDRLRICYPPPGFPGWRPAEWRRR